jgi:hypothetical protein
MANEGEQLVGGEGGIRTPDTLASMPHFECGAFNHSATSPALAYQPLSGMYHKNIYCPGPNLDPIWFHFPKIVFERLPMTAAALVSAFFVRLA